MPGRVETNIGSVKAVVDRKRELVDKDDPIDDDEFDEIGSTVASENALHELGHHIAKVTSLKDDTFEAKIEYYDKLVPEKIGKRVLRAVMKQSPSPRHREKAVLTRQIEIAEAIREGVKYEDYDNSPREKIADQIRDEAVEQWPEGYTPIRIIFKKQVPESAAA